MPATVALIVIANPVISVLFERGAFGSADTEQTATALSCYAIGLPAYCMLKVLTPSYFARGDTVTPLKVGIVAVLANLFLNLILMGPFLHVGIALATAVSGWLNVSVLFIILVKRGHLTIDKQLKFRLPRTLLSSMIMGVFLWLGLSVFGFLLDTIIYKEVLTLVFLICLGLCIYIYFAILMGVAKIEEFKNIFRQ